MGSYSRFELFLDCLWGLALLLAWHLLPFSFFKAESLRSLLSSPAMMFQAAVLLTFAYLFILRIHRNIYLYQHSRVASRRSGGRSWSVDE